MPVPFIKQVKAAFSNRGQDLKHRFIVQPCLEAGICAEATAWASAADFRTVLQRLRPDSPKQFLPLLSRNRVCSQGVHLASRQDAFKRPGR